MGAVALLVAMLFCAAPLSAQTPPESEPQAELQTDVQTDGDSEPQTEPQNQGAEGRYYLGGPRLEPSPGEQRKADAQKAPTSILIGPYVPPRSIPSPAFTSSESQRDGEQPDAENSLTEQSVTEQTFVEQDISIDSLDRLDPAAIGVWVDEAEPAFPVTIWEGSPRALLSTLLPALPAESASPPVRALMRRLLLSPAILPPLPVAAEGAPENSESVPSLIEARLERLYAMGRVEDFLALANELPKGETGAIEAPIETLAITRMHSDALLAIGDYDQACTLANDAISRSGAAYWLRITALCAALDDQIPAARFKLALLADSNEADPAFFSLMEKLLTQDNTQNAAQNARQNARMGDGIAATSALDPALFALARLTQSRLAADLALRAPPLLLDKVARLPGYEPETQLHLALRAARHGFVDGPLIAAAFAAIPFDEAQRAGVFSSLEAANNPASAPDATTDSSTDSDPETAADHLVSGLKLDALLWQFAAEAKTPAERARWIEIAFQHGRKAGRARAMAAALSGPLDALDASMSLAGYADSMGRVHLLNGQPEQALGWYEAARIAADAGNADALRAQKALWALILIADADPSMGFEAALLDQWLASADEARADLLLSILYELGYSLETADTRPLWLATAPARTGPSAFLWRQMVEAIREQRLGESLLTSLVAIRHSGGIDGLSAPVLATILAALREANLKPYARDLALDVLLTQND
ncbi:hypothetical protein JCM17846_31010 [Iodidimonas nitroreducens]|uniref:Antifreeze glycopeptide polyprotein n=1 Tax=Iodidimonas nitroreducens TaxID=1236968 RepID=A0A5A7NED3_9PROT|nr:hypothetical protein JCM17846_31010 [Iodidimonas nitroreducens]